MRVKLIRVVALAAAVCLVAMPVAADANTQSNQAEAHTVTQTFWMDYNTGACSNGIPKVQITGGRIQWNRQDTSRKVSVGHLFLAQGFITCANDAVSPTKRTTHHPVFGCGGRCSNLVTEMVGTGALSWVYVHRSGDGNAASGSGHGHVTNASGDFLGGICTRISIHNMVTACE